MAVLDAYYGTQRKMIKLFYCFKLVSLTCFSSFSGRTDCVPKKNNCEYILIQAIIFYHFIDNNNN